jgi:hypothetical protein
MSWEVLPPFGGEKCVKNCCSSFFEKLVKFMEGVNSTMIYLIYCKNFCKCHDVPPPSIIKMVKKMTSLVNALVLGFLCGKFLKLLLLIQSLRFFVSSWVGIGHVCLSRNFSISSQLSNFLHANPFFLFLLFLVVLGF